MLSNLSTVVMQVAVLFILIATGTICRKVGFLDKNSVKHLTNIVLYIVTPCVIINSFDRSYDKHLARNLLVCVIVAFATYVLSILIASLCFGKNEGHERVYRFATVFSNCGFMSLPLQQAIVGDIGVFYGAAFIAVFNIMVWTWGVMLMSGDKNSFNLKKLLINPGIIGVTLGLLVFFLGINIPQIIKMPIQYMAALNTPVPMLIIGYYIGALKPKDLVTDKKQYLMFFLRLIAIPAAVLAVMYFAGIRGDILTVCIIAVCAPAAANTTMFAAKYDADAEVSARLVSMSTLLSVITMPLMISFARSL